jgi:hypothetical protein
MAWVTEGWDFSSGADGIITVRWCRKDPATKGIKCGSFDHSLDPAKTWATIKADIEAKVEAEVGLL